MLKHVLPFSNLPLTDLFEWVVHTIFLLEFCAARLISNKFELLALFYAADYMRSA